MEVVLVRYIGAGLALALSGLSPRVPRENIPDGLGLIKRLSHDAPPALRSLIETCAREICRNWRDARIPEPIVLQHLGSLPALLLSHGPTGDDFVHILGLIPPENTSRKFIAGLAQDLSVEIVSSAASAGVIQRSAMLINVSIALLQQLFESLIANIDEIRALLPAAERLYAPEFAGDTDLAPDALAARIQSSTCPPQLISALVKEARSKGLSDHDVEAQLEAKAFVCQELIGDLKSLIVTTSDDICRSELEAALTRLVDGDPAIADEILAHIEDAGASRSDRADETDGNHAMASIRTIRAKLDEARGDLQGAAKHFAIARRHYPSYDLTGRWKLMMRQASALTRHGIVSGDIRALFEAAQVHAEAGGLVQEQDAPLEWATAHVELGNLLLKLAEREGRPERYLAAALHFKPAVDVFSREGATDDWAFAQLGLAHALKGQGEFQGDPVILGDAAFAYRASLGMLHAGRAPSEWVSAKAGLGVSLVRIAEETGELGLMDEAIASLKTALSNMRRSEARPLEAALGRAYVVLASEKEDVSALNDAVERLNRALEPSDPSIRATVETAQLLRLLGSSLWALGEAAGDRSRLETALSTLASARDNFTALGETSAAQDVAKEIANLEVALVRMRRAQRHAAAQARLIASQASARAVIR